MNRQTPVIRDRSDPDLKIPDAIAQVITDPFSNGDGRIHTAMKWLRANNPLGYVDCEAFDPFWVVTKQADIRAIAMRPEQFHSGDNTIVLMDKAQQRFLIQALDSPTLPARHLVQMDPPDHPKYRAVSAELFHARSLDAMTGDIRAIANEFIDRMAAKGNECDFARDVAFVYPLRVIMSILGVPPEDEMHLLDLTRQQTGSHDPEHARDGKAGGGEVSAEQILAVSAEFDAYFDVLLEDRRRNPRADLISIVANSTIDGAPMPIHEQRGYCQVAATAGHDTTAASTAGGMLELARNPAEFAKLKADPSLVNAFVEEAIRWVSPSKVTMRTAAADIDLCNRRFRKGDWIGLAWVSGNRDEDVFEDPDVFKADRKQNKLLSFGNGPHVCIGQHLARLEMRVLYEELLKRLDSVELAGEPRGVASFMISGPDRVPIRFRMK